MVKFFLAGLRKRLRLKWWQPELMPFLDKSNAVKAGVMIWNLIPPIKSTKDHWEQLKIILSKRRWMPQEVKSSGILECFLPIFTALVVDKQRSHPECGAKRKYPAA